MLNKRPAYTDRYWGVTTKLDAEAAFTVMLFDVPVIPVTVSVAVTV
jgi:hypothetical protein